jgi:hypothetical protein
VLQSVTASESVLPVYGEPDGGVLVMMDRMMDGMGWGMGAGGLIALVLLALVIAALVKYVFFR